MRLIIELTHLVRLVSVVTRFDVQLGISLLGKVRSISCAVSRWHAAVLGLVAWHLRVVSSTLVVCMHSFLVGGLLELKHLGGMV